MNETSSITSLKGIGEKTKNCLQKWEYTPLVNILLIFPDIYQVSEDGTDR